MKLFKKLLLVFFLINVNAKADISCKEFFAQNSKAFLKNKGAQVFVAYVFKYYQEQGINLSKGLIQSIIYSSSGWREDSANMFLSLLERRIGFESTVKKIIQTSYLKNITYNNFKERIDFYDKHVGKDVVNSRLNRSLAGFETGQISEIFKIIKFIKSYMGEEAVKEFMIQNPLIFSKGNLERLKENRDLFTEYIKNKKTVKQLMRRNPLVFSKEDPKRLKENVEFIKEYIKDEKTVKELIIKNPLGFSKADPKRLKENVEFIEQLIGKTQVIKLMTQSLQDFSRSDLNRLKQNIEVIKSYIGEEGVKEVIERHIRGFLMTHPNKLKQNIDFVLIYIKDKDEIKKLMIRSLQAFSKINLNRFKKTVDFIEAYIGEEGVAKGMKKNLNMFSVANLKELKELEKRWGKALFKKRLEDGLSKILLPVKY